MQARDGPFPGYISPRTVTSQPSFQSKLYDQISASKEISPQSINIGHEVEFVPAVESSVELPRPNEKTKETVLMRPNGNVFGEVQFFEDYSCGDMELDDNSCSDSVSLLPFAVEPDLVGVSDGTNELRPVDTSKSFAEGYSSVMEKEVFELSMDFSSPNKSTFTTGIQNDSPVFVADASKVIPCAGDQRIPTLSIMPTTLMTNCSYSRTQVCDSLNFSRLIKEAEGDSTCKSLIPEESRLSGFNKIHSEPYFKTLVNRHSSHSFCVSVILENYNSSAKEVMDVVCNPDMLRFWDESIENLVVTSHKGGAGKLHPATSRDRETMYQEPNLEDFDDDLIVAPGISVEHINQAIQASQSQSQKQREQYDGEWVEASTSEIRNPISHSSIVEDCVRKTRNILGFAQYGSVTMFIERNLSQVSFTVGPFKGGISLSHKIMVHEDKLGVNGLVLQDEVKVIDPLTDSDRESTNMCSCFENIKEVWSEWFSPSIEGYISQTRKSMFNLGNLLMQR